MKNSLFFFFLFLPAFCSAVPFSFELNFNQQVIGQDTVPVESGWAFSGSSKMDFSVDLPNFQSLYVFDFGQKSLFEIVDSELPASAPADWAPLISTDHDFSFTVSGLQGDSRPDLFLLSDDGSGLKLEHLDKGQGTSVLVSVPTRFFLAIDPDDFGGAVFSISAGGSSSEVSVLFRKIPSAYELIGRFSMACSSDPSHKCLVFDGKEFDVTNCLDADYNLNVFLGVGAPPEVCINGEAAYREWRENALLNKVSDLNSSLAAAESKTETGLELQVNALRNQVNGLSAGLSISSSDSNGFLLQGIAGLIILIVFFTGSFIVSKRRLPMKSFTRIKELFMEDDINGKRKDNPEDRRLWFEK